MSQHPSRKLCRKMRSLTVLPIGKEVQRCRLARGWTQEDLARQAGVHKKTVYNAEAGKPIQARKLADLALALGVPIEQLQGGGRRAPASDHTRASHAGFRFRGGAPPPLMRLIGREADLKAIRLRLKSAVADGSSSVVIHGLGGVGKSSVLHALAKDASLATLFPGGGLWNALGTSPDLLACLRNWGNGLRIPAQRLTRVDEAAAAVRERLQGRRVLIMIDDVWAEAHAQTLAVGDVGSVLLFTTRLADLAVRLAASPDLVYPLRGLAKHSAIQLLASYAPNVVRRHPQLCDDLVQSVDGLPLALVVAGKMLQREAQLGEDIPQLIGRIRKDARTLLQQPAPPDMSDLLAQTTPSVAAVLRRSTESLPRDLRLYFARLGSFAAAPETFPLFYAASAWGVDTDQARSIARQLIDWGILEQPRHGQYAIHPLMKALALHEWDMLHDSPAS